MEQAKLLYNPKLSLFAFFRKEAEHEAKSWYNSRCEDLDKRSKEDILVIEENFSISKEAFDIGGDSFVAYISLGFNNSFKEMSIWQTFDQWLGINDTGFISDDNNFLGLSLFYECVTKSSQIPSIENELINCISVPASNKPRPTHKQSSYEWGFFYQLYGRQGFSKEYMPHNPQGFAKNYVPQIYLFILDESLESPSFLDAWFSQSETSLAFMELNLHKAYSYLHEYYNSRDKFHNEREGIKKTWAERLTSLSNLYISDATFHKLEFEKMSQNYLNFHDLAIKVNQFQNTLYINTENYKTTAEQLGFHKTIQPTDDNTHLKHNLSLLTTGLFQVRVDNQNNELVFTHIDRIATMVQIKLNELLQAHQHEQNTLQEETNQKYERGINLLALLLGASQIYPIIQDILENPFYCTRDSWINTHISASNYVWINSQVCSSVGRGSIDLFCLVILFVGFSGYLVYLWLTSKGSNKNV